MRIKLRLATPQDAEALLEIYAPYVKQTAISFEYDVPGAAEFAGRIEQTLQRYPYLLAYVSDEAACANDERDEILTRIKNRNAAVNLDKLKKPKLCKNG